MDEHVQTDPAGGGDGNWWNDSKVKEVDAVVVILGCTLAAKTYRTYEQRLLDVLNRSFVADSRRIGKEFMPLREVEAFFSTGEQESLASTHVNKSSILFVAERRGGQPDRTGISEAEANVIRPKKAVSAKVDIPPYVLFGKMHAGLKEELVHVIDGDGVFLPLTDVSISPPLPTGECKFAFVALNKHQIVRVEESSGLPEPPAPPVRRAKRRKPKAAARTKGKSDQQAAEFQVPVPEAGVVESGSQSREPQSHR